MKKFIIYLLGIITILTIILFVGKNFIMKEILQRRLSQINNAPVTLGSVELSFSDKYIIINDIQLASNVDEKIKFIKIDKLKSYYDINYPKKIITLDDTEIIGITFFENDSLEYKEDIAMFENKLSKSEENFKKDKVLTELKNIYLSKVDIDNDEISKMIATKYGQIKSSIDIIKSTNDYSNIQDSINNLKNLNLSNTLDAISNIGKNAKDILKNSDLKSLKNNLKELKNNEDIYNLIDEVMINFLNNNRFVLNDLDSYINIYLNAVYEKKIYEASIKYRSLINEIKKRIEIDRKKGDNWEIKFNSISLTADLYGIHFNGEIKNFSSRLSENLDNIPFKLFGEKNNTIGEFRGFLNLNTLLSEASLNIPEANLIDFNDELLRSGEAFIEQSVSANNYDFSISGTVILKNMRLNSLHVVDSIKINDGFLRELLIPILEELNVGYISYSYDTVERNLRIKTDISEVFERIINEDNNSLKLKIRNQIKKNYLKSFNLN